MNKERILKLADSLESCKHVNVNQLFKLSNADIIDQRGKDLFTMRLWSIETCETPGCIAGHTCQLFLARVPQDQDIMCRARQALELRYDQADKLFVPQIRDLLGIDRHDVSLYTLYDVITPKIAAETLRNLAKTGEVVWDSHQILTLCDM